MARLLLGNLNSVNRVPLSEALETLCRRYRIDIGDLWPFSGMEGSLINIRNKRAHGEPLTDMQTIALMTASEHLRWMMERLLLGILGWPIDKSGVDKQHLAQWIPYLDWKAHRFGFEKGTKRAKPHGSRPPP